jgi:hypothetical protein
MENINGVFINDIVKDFQHPAFGIETEQKVFVLVFCKVNLILINPVCKSAANICLVYMVTESGLAELNITEQHIPILPKAGKIYNLYFTGNFDSQHVAGHAKSWKTRQPTAKF